MRTKSDRGSRSLTTAAALLAGLLAAPATAQVTSLVSLDVHGDGINKDAFGPTISADGRYVGFFAYDDLMDLGVHSDAYLRDRFTGVLERISVSSNEVMGDSYSYGPMLSADLRYAAFVSYSANLVPGDTNGPYPTGIDVFVRDRQAGTTERISVDSLGAQGNGMSWGGWISADGRYVGFRSDSSNLVPGDTNGVADVFVHDRQTHTTARVSVDSVGAEANGASDGGQISADGRYVAFYSSATNLVAGDTNGVQDAFVHDRQTGTTERVSVASGGAQGDGDTYSHSISPDGRYVGIHGFATNLVAGDTNGAQDAFIHDRQTGATERVSVGSGGTQGNAASQGSLITPDGRYVLFLSSATNLVAGDTNAETDIFVRDRQLGTTERISVDSNGAEGDEDSWLGGITPDGRIVAFSSRSKYVETDTNQFNDVYVRDRAYVAMVSQCEPGVGGVIACPCSNAPSSLGRGCDNSAGTGGASLAASGIAYLSQDTLVFTTSREPANALSILVQGSAPVASGAVYGQGVRCAGGTLKRLYTKAASGGSITAPDFGAGDPTVATRSAAVGDSIPAGQSRGYFVYYRDPVVLGGCPASSTFNATQTGAVSWIF
jgi:hypothetical protein